MDANEAWKLTDDEHNALTDSVQYYPGYDDPLYEVAESIKAAGFAAGQVAALNEAADADFLRLRAEGFIKFEQNPTAERVQEWLRGLARAVELANEGETG